MSNSMLEPAVPAGSEPSAKRGPTRRIAAVLLSGLMLCAFLVTTGGTAQAQVDPANHWMATWNMQVGTDRWTGAATIARQNAVLALQEVPNTQPASSFYLGTNGNIDSYLWDVGSGTWRYLYILRTPTRNLGIATSFVPNAVVEVPGAYRPALAAVREEADMVFASIHAASGSGFDVPGLLQNVANEATGRGINHWAVLGDFNRAPDSLNPGNMPFDSNIYNTGQATQQSGGELDYMVSNVETDNWQATVGPNHGSDHWPVWFGGFYGAAGPRQLTIHADNSDRLVDVYQGLDINGTHVIIQGANGGANQRFKLQPSVYVDEDGDTLYRIVGEDSGKCVDVENGIISGNGNYLNIWTCHGQPGQPNPDPSQETQYWSLENPVPYMPNLTVIRNYATHRVANIDHNGTGNGTWLIQWPYGEKPLGWPVINERFYFHPVVK